jgi:hypothetical protein
LSEPGIKCEVFFLNGAFKSAGGKFNKKKNNKPQMFDRSSVIIIIMVRFVFLWYCQNL